MEEKLHSATYYKRVVHTWIYMYRANIRVCYLGDDYVGLCMLLLSMERDGVTMDYRSIRDCIIQFQCVGGLYRSFIGAENRIKILRMIEEELKNN